MRIEDNAELILLDGSYESKLSMGGELRIMDNPRLISRAAFFIDTVGGNIFISGPLAFVQSFEELTGTQFSKESGKKKRGLWVDADLIAHVQVRTDAQVVELAQMIGPDGVLENINIWIESDVTDLAPLRKLTHIMNGGIEVRPSSNLVSLEPLEKLKVIQGDLKILGSKALIDMSLPSLIEVGGNLDLFSNKALSDISLPLLTKVGGRLQVFDDALTELSLPALTEVGGQLSVEENNALTSSKCQICPLFLSILHTF